MGELRLSVLKRIVQLRTFNPKYLDKTGDFIWRMNKTLISWRGGITGFEFESSDGVFKGSISVDDFSFSTETQSSHDQMKEFLLDGYSMMLKVYEDFEVRRIGYRIIQVAREKEKKVVKFLMKFYNNDFLKIFGRIDRYEVAVRMQANNDVFYTVRLLYGQWEKDQKTQLGLVVDVDVFKNFDHATKASSKLRNVLSEFFENAAKIHDDVVRNIKERW